MKRLVIAAVLAVLVHAVLFYARIPWARPKLSLPRSRVVAVDLVTFKRPEPTPPPVPEAVPKPKPKPKPKPIAKRVKAKPRRVEPPKPAKKTVPRPKASPEPLPVSVPEEENAVPEVLPQEAPLQAAVADQPAGGEAAGIIASAPRYDINPPFVYPRLAIRRRYEGLVLLDVLVTREGRVAEVKVNRSSGHAILDRRAVTTVQKWLFTPAHLGSRTMEAWVQVPVRFELR